MRFQPDTLREALLRPIAMAAPDASVYIEIMAPDLRFVFVLALLLLWALLAWRGRSARGDGGAPRPVLVLVTVLAVAFVAWLATTGNGRYFIAALLLAGPLCVGLAALLPLTRAFRLTLAIGMVALQGFVVQQSDPLRAWGLGEWTQAPYFAIEVPPDLRSTPATIVTMSAISYSLVAPQFHPQSRWIDLLYARRPQSPSPDGRRTRDFLAKPAPGPLLLFIPFVPGTMTSERLPDDEVAAVIDDQIRAYGLGLSQPRSCRFLPSRGLAATALKADALEDPVKTADFGFWVCGLARLDPADTREKDVSSRYETVFRKLEAQCPRLFASYNGTQAIPGGEVRSYLGAEMKAYVLDSGDVYYKYYRAFNPVRIGSVDDVLQGKARVDCGQIRGRSGLPWERQI